MGGVDMLDNFMSCYRPVFKSKKWWWPLFVNGINMLVVASWRIHCELGGKHDQLTFRRLLVSKLMNSCEAEKVSLTGPHPRPFDDVRTDDFGHHLVRMEDGRQRRCKECNKNARLQCLKCNVPLHLHCEQKFHSK